MKAALCLIFAFLILPINLVGAQNLKPSDNLTVQYISSYSYRTDDGFTIVTGEVQNNNNFPVTSVKLRVSFYDDKGKLVDTNVGTTLLKIVSAGERMPFLISSTKQDSSITDVSINLTGFNSSPPAQESLEVIPEVLEISDKLMLSGTVTNKGSTLTTGIILYLITYDAFDRVIRIVETNAQPEDIAVSKTSQFDVESNPEENARTYKIIAQSDQYQSELVDVTNINSDSSKLSKLVTIASTTITDPSGNKYNTIPVGAQVNITSGLWIKYASDQNTEQPYVCYVQIKRVGMDGAPSTVEFIGKSEGVFHGVEKQYATITWFPESKGAFFMEVYVWDPNAIALATPSSMINVVLVELI